MSFELRHRAAGRVAVGVDEVGRGCLAGPVVTAAVVLPEFVLGVDLGAERKRRKRRPKDKGTDDTTSLANDWWLWLNDSKLIAPLLRKQLAEFILRHAEVQVAFCLPTEIDRWNILHASFIAMRRALWPFAGRAQTVLVDGHLNPFETRFRCPEGEAEKLGFSHIETLVKGDQRSVSIAAASIVAKVYRDEWMAELGRAFPEYGFAEHKGYSTPLHYAALERLGPCPLHRMSFAPLKTPLARQLQLLPDRGEESFPYKNV